MKMLSTNYQFSEKLNVIHKLWIKYETKCLLQIINLIWN